MKNLISHTLRTGFLMTAAITVLMANMVIYAAEDDPRQPAGIFAENDVISGTVTEVGTGTITVKTYGYMDEGGRMNGETPPEMNGERQEPPEGQTPPEMNGEMPQPPEGMDGLRGDMPEGRMRGGYGQEGSDTVVETDADTTVVRGDAEASLSDITVGTNVMILLDGSKAQTIVILE